MTVCYLDASAVLRFVLNQPGQLDLRTVAQQAISSELLEVECGRVLDRLRLSEKTDADDLLQRADSLREFLRGVLLLPINRAVRMRAAGPLQHPLGTLDALHLATALAGREGPWPELSLATHDRALARAARSYGFSVLGAII